MSFFRRINSAALRHKTTTCLEAGRETIQRLLSCCSCKTPKSSRAMSAKGTPGLYFLPHSMTMNGSRYLNVLKEKLELYMNVHQCDTFMHDDAPCHRSTLVSSFLQENQVKVLDWQGNSPDLNPIENLWKLKKDRVAEKHPTCLKSLENAIKVVWTKEISSDFFKQLTDSTPRRLQAVIGNRGGHTFYDVL